MNSIQLLDVTLRDGGYKTNFHFPLDFIRKVLTTLDQSGVEYIEVGYRNGSFKPLANIGQTGLCGKNYLLYCRKFIKSAKLTIIYHPINIQQSDLEEMRECGVDCVRICFPAKNLDFGFQSIEIAKKFDFEVIVNITRASEYSIEQLLDMTLAISKYNIKTIYLADSNGNLTPEKVKTTFDSLLKNINVNFGFHAHDNLFSSQANAIAAIGSGVKYIDASIFGFGKGAGNLRTEGIISFLQAQGNHHYDLCKILQLADYVRLNAKNLSGEIATKDIIMGIFNLSQDDAARVGEFLNVNNYYSLASDYSKQSKEMTDA